MKHKLYPSNGTLILSFVLLYSLLLFTRGPLLFWEPLLVLGITDACLAASNFDIFVFSRSTVLVKASKKLSH